MIIRQEGQPDIKRNIGKKKWPQIPKMVYKVGNYRTISYKEVENKVAILREHLNPYKGLGFPRGKIQEKEVFNILRGIINDFLIYKTYQKMILNNSQLTE